MDLRALNAADIPRAALVRAVDGAVRDVMTVAYHTLSNPVDYPPCRTLDVLFDHLQRRVFPPLAVVEKVAGWTLFVMQWRSRYRPLTDEERDIHAAAQRVWDALEGVPLA